MIMAVRGHGFSSFFYDYKRYFVILGVLLVVQVFLAVRVVILNSSSSFWPTTIRKTEHLEKHVSDESAGSKLHKKGNGLVVYPLNISLTFTPPCEIYGKEAYSAIVRAKTEDCKQRLFNISCRSQENILYSDRLPRFCQNNVTTYRRYIGCFRDDLKNRILPEYSVVLKELNSPTFCIDLCLQYGYEYAGVQYSVECFCGSNQPRKDIRLPETECNMQCPCADETCQSTIVDQIEPSLLKTPSANCGGHFAMNIYETGLLRNFEIGKAKNFSDADTTLQFKDRSARVVFLLSLNGRAVRQVVRLIKSLFHVNHYFYIHIDARQDYLYRELLFLTQVLPGRVKFMRNRRATIWGGASLLEMLLGAMEDLVLHSNDWGWNWDYVINLSESDFPLKSVERLSTFLTLNMGKNFVKSHGREVHKFIQKQGLDKTFYECEYRMWRIGDRILPKGITWDGGSDWIALHRKFVEYLIHGQDDLLKGLRQVFKYTLLPAESFFHTTLRNSDMCSTFVDNNLHVTNWKRKFGCKCQYKNVVDWCGCSPNDFRMSDLSRLKQTESKLMFFGRKFESIVNQAITNEMEKWIDETLYKAHESTANQFWLSVFHHADLSPKPEPVVVILGVSLSRLSLKRLSKEKKPSILTEKEPNNLSILKKRNLLQNSTNLIEITVYNYNDEMQGLLVRTEIKREARVLSLESFFRFRPTLQKNFDSVFETILVKASVGVDYDQKEQIFRQYHTAIGPTSEPTLSCSFNSPEVYEVEVSWLSPSSTVESVSTLNVTEGATTSFVKPALLHPLPVGIWTVHLKINSESSFASIKFLVLPSHHPNAGNDISMSLDDVATERGLGSDGSTPGLDDIDAMVEQFYSFQDACIEAKDLNEPDWKELGIVPCIQTEWSSMFPDPKSTILGLNASTGRLVP